MQATFKDTDLTQAPTWSAYPEGCSVCQPQGINTRFDYIFASPDISFDSCVAHPLKASDHLPVSVEIDI
jgi:endonuclease/exonuclease/phosphatase family metal-dependent hydrolase